MLNPLLQVLYKDGTIADNHYQLVDEEGYVPKGDVVVNASQLDLLAQITGKKAIFVTVDTSPEDHGFPLNELDAIFIDFVCL